MVTTLELKLWHPHNTHLHRAGLGGLALVLQHLESLKGKVIDWELFPDSITLMWDSTDKDALLWLLEQTYRTKEGMIHIPALGNISPHAAVTLHNGLTNTFLLHPMTVTSAGGQMTVLEFDENQFLEVRYKALEQYSHRNLGAVCKDAFTTKGTFKKAIYIRSWLYPGGGVKHEALGSATRLQDTPAGLIALLFAPVACGYYRLRSRLKAEKARWALVIPHIINLLEFAAMRQSSGWEVATYDRFWASGLSDASLHYLTTAAGIKTAGDYQLPGCEVWSFGDVPWSKLSCITQCKSVSPPSSIREQYKLCDLQLRKGVKIGRNGTYIDVSFGREIASENLIAGKPWYWNLHKILHFSSDIWRQLFYEKEGLRNMLEKSIERGFTQEEAIQFIDAVTWQLKERYNEARRNTQSSKPNYDKVRSDILMDIRLCRTASNFNRLVVNFFSRPNTNNPFLQDVEKARFYFWCRDNWEECLALMTLAVTGYQNPWKTPRTAAILREKFDLKPTQADLTSDSTLEEETNEQEVELAELETVV